MADLMWSTVKEPLDTTLCFDKESLDLAFKYFMSPTLTMRLAGLSQITVSYICFIFGHFLFTFQTIIITIRIPTTYGAFNHIPGIVLSILHVLLHMVLTNSFCIFHVLNMRD